MKKNIQLTVSTTAAQFCPANQRRGSLALFNNSLTETVYLLDDANQPTTLGFPLPPQTGYVFQIPHDDPRTELWVATAANTADLRGREEYSI